MSIPQNSAWKTRLVERGFPDRSFDIEFWQEQVVYQIGIAPVRIDILTEITGVESPDAWRKRVASTFFGVPVNFISLDDLVTNKQALGRSTDLKDLKQNPKSAHLDK